MPELFDAAGPVSCAFFVRTGNRASFSLRVFFLSGEYGIIFLAVQKQRDMHENRSGIQDVRMIYTDDALRFMIKKNRN